MLSNALLLGSIDNAYTVKAFTQFQNGGPLNNMFLEKISQDLLPGKYEHSVFPGKREHSQKDSIMQKIRHDLSPGVHFAKQASEREHSAPHRYTRRWGTARGWQRRAATSGTAT